MLGSALPGAAASDEPTDEPVGSSDLPSTGSNRDPLPRLVVGLQDEITPLHDSMASAHWKEGTEAWGPSGDTAAGLLGSDTSVMVEEEAVVARKDAGSTGTRGYSSREVVESASATHVTPQPGQAELLGEDGEDGHAGNEHLDGDVTHDYLAHGRARVRWTKASWWAKQEAQRKQDGGPSKGLSVVTSVIRQMMKQHKAVAPLDQASSPQSLGTLPRNNSQDSMRSLPRNNSGDSLVSAASAGEQVRRLRRRASETSVLYSDNPLHGDSIQAREASTGLDAVTEKRTVAEKGTAESLSQRVLQSKRFVFATLICTFWLLIGGDTYLLQSPPVSMDRPTYSLYVICAVQFLADLILRCKVDIKYRFGFYFWLDLIALVSLVPELVFVLADYDVFDLGAASMARSGRVAAAGGRVMRIVRIMKLLHHVYELHRKGVKKTGNALGDSSGSEIESKLEEYVTVREKVEMPQRILTHTHVPCAPDRESAPAPARALLGILLHNGADHPRHNK